MPSLLNKIRLMIVDDSASFRHLLQDILKKENDIEVVGTAATGNSALMKLDDLQPELIILDIHMPGMDGIKTLRAIKQLNPKIGVIICTAFSEAGADLALEALSSGALDFVMKAPQLAPGETLIGRLRTEIIPRIRAFRRLQLVKTSQTGEPPASDDTRLASVGARDIIAIGVSTGGPMALRTVLPEIPPDIRATILIVQHMPSIFTKRFAEQLTAICRLPVKEAEDREEAQHGVIYIAPGDYHLEVRRRGTVPMLMLTKGPPENSVRPAVDVLFRSIAAGLGTRTLGIILTGMGSDGFLGTQYLKAAGAYIVAQDQASSVIWGMPRFVAEAGLADRVCSLSEISRLIGRLTLKGSDLGKGD